MKKSTQFMLLTIAIDVLLLYLLGLVSLPGDPSLYAIAALLFVSPMLTYLVVYRDDYRRPLRRFGDRNDVER